MPFPEGFPGHGDVQKQFSRLVVEQPQTLIIENTPHILQLSDLITPEQSLTSPYRLAIERTISGLGLLPQQGRLPVADHWQPHRNSKGRYFVEYETVKQNPVKPEREDLFHIYSYVLPPDSSTSIHAHAAIEFYFLHAGAFTLALNGEEAPLSRFAVVGPGVEHTGRTGKEPALITAITYNPLGIPIDQLHEYAWTDMDWTEERSAAFHEFLDRLEGQ